jgi:lipoprotein NlpD
VDGLYRVKRGDSLHAIAFKYGLDYKDIARWNNLRSADLIYPDQVLKLTPPPASSPRRSAGVTTSAAATPRATTRTQPVQQPVPRTSSQTASTPTPPPRDTSAETSASAVTSPPASRSISGWIWPVEGRLLRTFKEGDPSRNGLDIRGREGQAVNAASSGEVVYSGNGLIGYGELVIIKHSDTLLSAYAHNRQRLVREGERVSQGQKIAEMGRNDRNEELLHFEIRSNGKPVDPLKYLPKQ